MSPLTIVHHPRPARPSLAAAELAGLFGLTLSAPPPTVVVENWAPDIAPTDLVLITGPSGSGKSSVLRGLAARLGALDVQSLELPDAAVIDCLAGSVAERLQLLGACGLAEPALALRTPAELSEGQRARFRSALALTVCPAGPLAIDEFGAVLDRTTARAVAVTLSRLARRRNVGVLAATTHDDLSDDFAPDVQVKCLGDGRVESTRGGQKKRCHPSTASSGYRTVPEPTGRTSLGGITAATPSASRASLSCSGTTPTPWVSACSAAPPRA